ncbi:MAG: peptidoglycan-binding protein [Alphaproteobacteria bacterium]|nr:MAG: peptidoglycan-binding protein [Alphaproteobacteria bacterium]
MPRRRRARAVVVEADSERGFAMRILLHSPKDVVAGAFAFAAVIAIIANALFLQAGRHPSPMFGSVVAMPAAALAPASPLPRPRPVEADATLSEPKAADAKPAEPKATDPLASLVKATSAPAAVPSNIVRPPAPIPASSRNETIANPSPGSRRVAAVQRALTEYGYGQLKPTGTVGSDTQAAIQKFERERKLPVTGQMSDRLVRELIVVTGRPIE